MTQRSTTSANQPIPPFYAARAGNYLYFNQHTFAAVNAPPRPCGPCRPYNVTGPTVNITLGRDIDPTVLANTVNPQITDPVTKVVIHMQHQPPGVGGG